jgi:4-aminobutyrate aminotransferase-like enzyme
MVFEPQQGEGGFVPATAEFAHGLRRICDEHGIVLVADEVQTGFGRTGRMFALEHFDVEPDVLVLAKSIAAGLPLSAVVGRAEIMDAPHASAIGGTYVGNPVAQAAALAVLDVLEEESLLERAQAIGDVLRARMQAWQDRFPRIGDVRAKSRPRSWRLPSSKRRRGADCFCSRPGCTGTASVFSVRS